jgi:hypothetical protein
MVAGDRSATLGEVLFGCDYQAESTDYRQSDPVKIQIKHRNTRHEVPGVPVVANGFRRPKAQRCVPPPFCDAGVWAAPRW